MAVREYLLHDLRKSLTYSNSTRVPIASHWSDHVTHWITSLRAVNRSQNDSHNWLTDKAKEARKIHEMLKAKFERISTPLANTNQKGASTTERVAKLEGRLDTFTVPSRQVDTNLRSVGDRLSNQDERIKSLEAASKNQDSAPNKNADDKETLRAEVERDRRVTDARLIFLEGRAPPPPQGDAKADEGLQNPRATKSNAETARTTEGNEVLQHAGMNGGTHTEGQCPESSQVLARFDAVVAPSNVPVDSAMMPGEKFLRAIQSLVEEVEAIRAGQLALQTSTDLPSVRLGGNVEAARTTGVPRDVEASRQTPTSTPSAKRAATEPVKSSPDRGDNDDEAREILSQVNKDGANTSIRVPSRTDSPRDKDSTRKRIRVQDLFPDEEEGPDRRHKSRRHGS